MLRKFHVLAKGGAFQDVRGDGRGRWKIRVRFESNGIYDLLDEMWLSHNDGIVWFMREVNAEIVGHVAAVFEI